MQYDKERRQKQSQSKGKTQKLRPNHNGYTQHNPENSERNLETDMNGQSTNELAHTLQKRQGHKKQGKIEKVPHIIENQGFVVTKCKADPGTH